MIGKLRRLSGRGPAVPFVYHPDYRRELAGIPLDAMRGERVLAFLFEEGLIRPKQVSLPRPASIENLRRVHSPEYLRSLEDPAEVGRVLGLTLRSEEAAAAVALQRLMAGGTIQASRLVRRSGGVAVHLGGGLHHAGPDRGTGFCLLNDVAVAIERLRARGMRAPVLVVDLDLHDGNGTRAAFARDPTVHTFSIHNERWDQVEALADTAVEVGAGVTDERYMEALRSALPPVVASHRPGFVFYVAGADIAATDAYGDAEVSGRGILARDQFVFDALRAHDPGIPIVVVLGGGYGATAWRVPARLSGWLLTGRTLEPPDDLTAALQRVRWLDRIGDPGSPKTTTDRAADALFSFSAEDLGALGVGDEEERLLLGRYSLEEVRRQLDRFGILPQLRARGYMEPKVELVASTGFGPTVRVFGSPERSPLVMELRVALDRSRIPGMTLLGVEWLLLQDPQAEFTPWRPPLPGQDHPGIGVLADVVAWLVTVAREMKLDGLGFRSSHYYIAALAHRHLRFVDPRRKGEFAVIQRATEHLSLAEASRAVAEGRIEDLATSTPIEWVDVAMVVPLSDALRRSIGD